MKYTILVLAMIVTGASAYAGTTPCERRLRGPSIDFERDRRSNEDRSPAWSSYDEGPRDAFYNERGHDRYDSDGPDQNGWARGSGD
jgi:hypothetical protein